MLVVRLDSLGDMLVCGPSIRALAAGADRLTVLAGPAGAAAARLLPGVDEVAVWPCPWIDLAAPPITEAGLADVVARLRAVGADRAVVLTSFHQSALPTALVLRLAGIADVRAVSTDFAGSLLTARLAEPGDAPEPVRMLQIACAAAGALPTGDDGRLRVVGARRPALAPAGPFVVVHPGASAPSRAYPSARWREVVALLAAQGREVVVTGGPDERKLVAEVTGTSGGAGQAGAWVRGPGGPAVVPAVGLPLAELAGLLAAADVLMCGNTGPAHLAAAVGTPVVSLFSPVVPAERWAPFGVPVVLLGDQAAPCRGSRARECPVPGHPCLGSVPPAEVVAAADRLAPRPAAVGATA